MLLISAGQGNWLAGITRTSCDRGKVIGLSCMSDIFCILLAGAAEQHLRLEKQASRCSEL